MLGHYRGWPRQNRRGHGRLTDVLPNVAAGRSSRKRRRPAAAGLSPERTLTVITSEQRNARRKHIGSSDAPAILALSPWADKGDVYWSKILDVGDDAPTQAMETGNRLESPLLDFAADRLGVNLARNVFKISEERDGGILAANFDATVADRPEAVEAKYVGPDSAAQWGEEGTDEVPDYVNIQCQHQAFVGRLERVWVPALVIAYRPEWRLYCVRRCEAIIEPMVEAELAFWRDHVLTKTPPDRTPPPLSLLKALRREPETCIDLGPEAAAAISAREAAAEVKKKAEETYDDTTRAVLALLGDNESGRLPDGRLIRYAEENAGARCDTKRLRAEWPEVYQHVCTEGTRRVIRIKKGRNV